MVEGRARLELVTPRRAYAPMTLALRGRHQVDNAITAVRLLEELSAQRTFAVAESSVVAALTDVEWPARLEYLSHRGHTVVIDGAHNPAGARALSSYLRETYGRRLPMVVGIMRDKNVDALIEALAPAASQFVMAAASSPRAATPGELRRVPNASPRASRASSASPQDAVATALTLGDPIVVAGSLYLAGEVRANLWHTR
jgi:dihydrofolate synthase/folylpolyglutamate synthase